MSSEAKLVDVQINRGVALMTWNRPEHNNTWTLPLEIEYFGALKAAEANPDVRAIVVTGAGKNFCPGMGTDALQGIASGPIESDLRSRTPQSFPTTINKPIIAAINGACAGIGLIQAMLCDIRFAASGVKFTTAFARRGMPAEHGSAWTLSRLVGMANAMDLLLSARVVLAEEALALGLVHRVVEPQSLLTEAVAYAEDLAANCSPIAMATIKRQVYDVACQTLEEARLEAIDLWLSTLKAHPDFKEGVASFIDRRAPNFSPLGDEPTASEPR